MRKLLQRLWRLLVPPKKACPMCRRRMRLQPTAVQTLVHRDPPEVDQEWRCACGHTEAVDHDPEPPMYDDGPGPEPWQRAERKAGA